ncbi:5-methyltetrahydropteroyltriglutamate--homocysteine S-methyltransferase [Neiella marina]|uniref:5-methyltetrahydropteroyltriglutamate--homocysteine methyltransferase n=1 Tax=Neiella holothuriorum TaxID=2870530 RepID=A0ABS7EIE4_9GAMM|nr:5-methyltetrahydropteroyltriglutamate--homocysteine S-methyltransferase [Neiella holothuriorum]MBW8192123.1 5-methyltetrahydropteroyltriglutamate--homocysteine S-methyltransferase [Neiella holothuriorum]
MALSHNLGFPRVGAKRELKRALEAYWRGEQSKQTLEQTGSQLRQLQWQWQQQAGLDLVPVGDFAWYDHIAQLSQTFGVVPSRHQHHDDQLTQLFAMARGASACCGGNADALEMTKWFDTNYHYLVPELDQQQVFQLAESPLLAQVDEAQSQGVPVKPVLVGPISFLWLSKCANNEFDKLTLLPALLKVYQQLLTQLAQRGCDWIQIDEPVLSLDLPSEWLAALVSSYQALTEHYAGRILLANYFGKVADKLEWLGQTQVAGLHIDAVRGADELRAVAIGWPAERVLSVGIIDGRNVWRADLSRLLAQLKPLHEQRGDNLWLAPSCSLLHVPVDCDVETSLDDELRGWLAFARQKLSEVAALTRALNGCQSFTDRALFTDSDQVQHQRSVSSRVIDLSVRQRTHSVLPEHLQRRSQFSARQAQQADSLGLPTLPTTTIGSFPQTASIRKQRAAFKAGELSQHDYDLFIESEITDVVRRQQALDLDVLVHGEPERNDMVEYFGEQLKGVAVTQFGWVQSYGSRCVKPPLIYGDVSRPDAMTVRWSSYAQSLTDKPVKGMLTGPVTLLNWSFVRSDIARSDVAQQLALAVRDEVSDLEHAGIQIIQIDEPALREGLPLTNADRDAYLQWAVDAFCLSANGVADTTQIHTHMCYCEFDDVIEAIAKLDADVISIEASRSSMTLLDSFTEFKYPNAIGLGLYDIHSPNVPDVETMADHLNTAKQTFPLEQIWVNPDCGLKTRDWPETEAALANMVAAAKAVRQPLATR